MRTSLTTLQPGRARPAVALLFPFLLAPLAACASTGATFRSGVGDKLLERPPFYAGATTVTGGERIPHLPIAYQRGASQADIFDPSANPGSPTARLLAEMNAYLDSLRPNLRVRVVGAAPGTPPDVRFGCETDMSDDCLVQDPGRPRMKLAVGRPSPEWISWAAGAAAQGGSDRLLVITLEVGQYQVKQSGAIGQRKEVELGTGYTKSVPWLTSLETPVTVLQLTGAVVGADGLAVRIGAEGVLARRTNLLLSGFGAQALLTDEDVEEFRTARRDDLADRPLVWQAALRTLVSGLTGSR